MAMKGSKKKKVSYCMTIGDPVRKAVHLREM